jgi:magnesium transporter
MSPAAPHAPETAGEHMLTGVPRARADEPAECVLRRLGEAPAEQGSTVYVLRDDGRLVGCLPVTRLLGADAAAPVGALALPVGAHVLPGVDQEHVATMALRHGLDRVPVVDADGRLLGVVPPLAMLRVLRREHVEDLHVLAGIRREETQARHAIEDPPSRRARHRLPWLLVGLAGGGVATAAMAGFHATLEKTVAAAFFVPALVYLADAVGTQSEAIAVRGLSLTRGGIAHLLASELRTGMLIGATLGLIAYLPILAAFGDARLAGAVSFSLFIASSIASAIGLGLPWLFARRGWDPAYGSGPVATVIQDILTILVYFSVLRAFGI